MDDREKAAELMRLVQATLDERADKIIDMGLRIRTLEAELAEARKYAAPENASALSSVKNSCTQHNQYWTTASGACMACRAEKAEAELAQAKADREVLARAVLDMEAADGRTPKTTGPIADALSRAGGK